MILAPMANVTDASFRFVIAKYGKPDVMYTEFVSVDGLLSKGRESLLRDFMFDKSERPIVAQIFGSKPENFYKVAQLCVELGFDGIDINMGCPDRSVEKQGAGAALIKNPELAKKIIVETMRGAGDLPVSIKTRLGYNTNILEEWLPHLLETKPAAIIIHARTRKEMSSVPAQWDQVARAVEITKKLQPGSDRTLIIGNGDVKNVEEAQEKVKKYACDGVMIGRGIFGNPWLFSKTVKPEDITPVQKLSAMIEHTFLYEKIFTGHKSFDVMKKHYKAYVNGFDGAKELRMKLMEAKTATEVAAIVRAEYPEVTI